MIVVADASAVATFLLPDESGSFADFAKQIWATSEIYVPPHWHSEIANIIWKAHRRKRIAPDDLVRIASMATLMGEAATVGLEVSIDRLVDTASSLNLSAYDASYLLLARALAAPLLTLDNALRRAADRQGVRLLVP